MSPLQPWATVSRVNGQQKRRLKNSSDQALSPQCQEMEKVTPPLTTTSNSRASFHQKQAPAPEGRNSSTLKTAQATLPKASHTLDTNPQGPHVRGGPVKLTGLMQTLAAMTRHPRGEWRRSTPLWPQKPRAALCQRAHWPHPLWPHSLPEKLKSLQ